MPICDFEGYVDDDEFEDMESELVIDPAWEKQQKKTFTAWCNSHLRKCGQSIESIEHDFQDGLKLMSLLEVISGEILPKPDKGKLRFHKIANVNKALDFLAYKRVKLVSIGAEEIVSGNVKLTLGMIWTIILRFAIQDIQYEDSVAKQGLLLWCQKQTKDYKNVKVENFSTSFKDGLAFLAIIHKNRADLLKYSDFSKDDPHKNLSHAFNVAEKHLDIPRMLDPDDIVGSELMDERSVMAYLSSYYHCFSGARKANIAANRISNYVKMLLENNKLQEQYEITLAELLKWIEKKLVEFSNRRDMISINEVESLQQSFRHYRREEKPTKLAEKACLETTYDNLQTRLRLNNKKPYVPGDGCNISDIKSRWKLLDSSDRQFEEWILAERRRLERLNVLLPLFNSKCNNQESWSEGKPKLFSEINVKSLSLVEIRAAHKRFDAFQSDLIAHCGRIERINGVLIELEKLKYHDLPTVNQRYENIVSTWKDLEALCSKKLEEINRILPAMERIDELYLEFAKRAAPFNNWMEQTDEDLRDTFVVHTKQEVERLISVHENFVSTLTNAETECKELQALCETIKEIATKHDLVNAIVNPYTNIKTEELPVRWNTIIDLTNKRGSLLNQNLNKQIANDKMKKEFAENAENLNKAIEEHQSAIMKIMQANCTLEEQRDSLKTLETELNKHQNMLKEIDDCNHALEDASIFENEFTTCSLPMLRVAWEQLFSSLHYSSSEIEKQILTRDSKGLTAEQLNDWRVSFKHFDKNNLGRLDPHQFKACLVSLGHNFKDENGSLLQTKIRSDDYDFSVIMAEVDPLKTGRVTFDRFLEFMTKTSTTDASDEHLRQAFQTMSGDKGFLNEYDLRENLCAEEAEFCLKRMKPVNGPLGDSGALDYEQFVLEITKN